MTRRKWKTYGGRIFLMFAMPLLMLVVAECVLRVFQTGHLYFSETNPHYQGEKKWVRLQPNTDFWWYGCRYNVNGQGFRMPDEVQTNRPLRILCLGDSVTLGMGVQETEDVWPNRLKTLIEKNNRGKVEVINSGIQGWNLLTNDAENGGMKPAEYTDFLQEEAGPDFRPNLVVYGICLNDIPSAVETVFWVDNNSNKKRFNLFPEKSREWFKRKAFYRLARDQYRENKFYQLDFSGIPTPPKDELFWSEVSKEMQRMKDVAESLDAKLCCLIFPYSYQLLPKNTYLQESNKSWHKLLTELDIPFTDITRHFTAGNVLEYYATGDYIHLNTKGHHLIAEEALGLIEKDFEGFLTNEE